MLTKISLCLSMVLYAPPASLFLRPVLNGARDDVATSKSKSVVHDSPPHVLGCKIVHSILQALTSKQDTPHGVA